MHFCFVAFRVISYANKNYFPIKVARLAAAAAAAAALLQRPTNAAGAHMKWACRTTRDLHSTLNFVIVAFIFFNFFCTTSLLFYTALRRGQPTNVHTCNKIEKKQAKKCRAT